MEKLSALVALIPSEWPQESFILCGSAALAVRDIRDVHDLDVLIKPELWPGLSHLRALPLTRDEGYEQIRTLLRSEQGIDVFDELPRIGRIVDFDQAMAQATEHEISGRSVMVLSPRHTLAIKALAPSLPKHLDDMLPLAGAIAYAER